jgi:Mg2+/Co2+ transporter CorC
VNAILPLVLAIGIFILHRVAVTRSRGLVRTDTEALPGSRATVPALAVTEAVGVGLVATAAAEVFDSPVLSAASACAVLVVGLLVPLAVRGDGNPLLPAWMRGIARVWPTGVPSDGSDDTVPIAVAHDVDPFDEHALVERVSRLGETEIAEVMVPRGEVAAVDQQTDIPGFIELVEEHRHSRYPVIDGDLDRVVGVINVFDLQGVDTRGDVISSFARPATMVPEAKSAVELLDEMSRGGEEFALVVDEFGGTSGVVTMEDLVEQLVGEIWDEHERVEVRIRRVGQDVYVSEASMPLNEIELRLGVRFPEGDYETIAGYLLEKFGRIPVRGDTVSYEGMIFEVLTADRRRIESVQIDLRGHKARA